MLSRKQGYRYVPIDLIYRRLRNGLPYIHPEVHLLARSHSFVRAAGRPAARTRARAMFSPTKVSVVSDTRGIRGRSPMRDTAPRNCLFRAPSLRGALVLLLMQQTRLPSGLIAVTNIRSSARACARPPGMRKRGTRKFIREYGSRNIDLSHIF